MKTKYNMKYSNHDAVIDTALNFEEMNMSKLVKLVTLLNKKAFNLGSGHEEIRLSVIEPGEEYLLSLMPYYGHPGQNVQIERIK